MIFDATRAGSPATHADVYELSQELAIVAATLHQSIDQATEDARAREPVTLESLARELRDANARLQCLEALAMQRTTTGT